MYLPKQKSFRNNNKNLTIKISFNNHAINRAMTPDLHFLTALNADHVQQFEFSHTREEI